MGCLYQIEFPNAKKYIGITKFSAEKRFAGHFDGAEKGKKLLINNAIRKYGKENCKVSTLVISDDIEYLKDLEVKAIAAFNTRYPNGYNSTSGGDGVFDPAESVIKKMSISRKKCWQDPEYRAFQTEDVKRQWLDPEIRKSRTVCWDDPEKKKNLLDKRKKISESLDYRKKLSESIKIAYDSDPEIRKKVSEASKRAWQNPERRKKMSDATKQRCKDPAHIKKLSDHMKLRMQDESFRNKQKDSAKKYWSNPESIKAHSEKSKKYWKSSENKEEWMKSRHSDENRILHSQTMKEKWQSSDYRKKVSDGIKKSWEKRKNAI